MCFCFGNSDEHLQVRYRDPEKENVMEFSIFLLVWTLILAWVGRGVVRVVCNIFFHPLRKFPGPNWAKATEWWKTYIEVVKQESMTDVLVRLHKQYGMSSKVSQSAPTDLMQEMW
jgi:hypothetical protein